MLFWLIDMWSVKFALLLFGTGHLSILAFLLTECIVLNLLHYSWGQLQLTLGSQLDRHEVTVSAGCRLGSADQILRWSVSIEFLGYGVLVVRFDLSSHSLGLGSRRGYHSM